MKIKDSKNINCNCEDGCCCEDPANCECDCHGGRMSRGDFLRNCTAGAGLLAFAGAMLNIPSAGRAAEDKPTKANDKLPYQLEPVGEFNPGMDEILGVAFDGADRLLVSGSGGVAIFNPNGESHKQLSMSERACCACPAADGKIYAAHRTGVSVFDANGNEINSWGREGRGDGEFMYITALGLWESILYIMDAGNRRYHRFAVNGDFIDHTENFLIPSGYFDCAVDARGLLFVGHTGKHRIERYDQNGEMIGYWGQFGWERENFCGCCNPTHIVLFPDGRIATAEKGIFRVKVYTGDGELLACRELNPVEEAGSAGLNDKRSMAPLEAKSLDLAVDSSGRIAMVEPFQNGIRFYELKES